MADEKKPRIDLKARLGKKTVTTPGGPSIPPPVGIPKPSGVPVPPFGSQRQAAPKVDASDPYAAISADAAPTRSEPQAIKVEMSEEVVAAQKKGRARIIVLAAAAAVVGGAIGFSIGSGVERGKGADKAIAGAQTLVKKVDKANQELESLSEVLKSAKEKLADNKYPEEAVKKLGGIDIPFTGTDLVGMGIGRFKPEVVTMLVSFASGAAAANDQKDRIRSVLTGAKPAITDFLSQKSNPKVRWSMYLQTGPYGPWAVMQPLPKPFLVKQDKSAKDDKKPYKWPEKFDIKDSGKTYHLKRYTGGDPTKGGGDPKIIPVDPSSQGSVCPSDVLIKLRSELGKMQQTLQGDKTPGQEKQGLIDTGKILVEKLKGIGAPSG
jgi:hypothetical protein